MSGAESFVETTSKAAIPVAMIAVSFAAVLIRLSHSHPFTIAFYRMFFATLILLPPLYFRREEIKRITRSEWNILVLTGIFLAIHFAAWISSLRYTSVVSSVVLVTSHPLVVTWVSGWYLGEKSGRTAYMAILLSLGGITIMAVSNYQAEGWSLFGDILAIVGMLAFAGYIIRGRQMRRTMSTVTYSFVVYGVSSLVLGAMAFFFVGGVTSQPPREYLLFLSLAVIPTIFGHTLYNWALRFVRARLVSVSLLAEPLGASLLAFIILNEVPPYLTALGGAITLIGVFICSRSE
ncbi:MAG: DMT family transporter [Thermoplasmata archaeon]